MNYKEAFAVDKTFYSERKMDSNYKENRFELKNFDYYKPKLVADFYLKYFTRQLLIETDILELEDFLQYHFDCCENSDKFSSILEFKIIPKIKEIIECAQMSLEGSGYYDEIKLDDGFVESEGVIHNAMYDYRLINHYIAYCDLQNDIKKRGEIINSFLTKNIPDNNVNVLKWIGKPSHLAYMISQFIQEGYIEAPMKRDGEINYTELSKQILNSFNFSSKSPSVETLRRYCNVESDKFLPINEKFIKEGFYLPDSKITG